MEICPVCRASLNGVSTCRRCRTDLQRAQEIERLGQYLSGRVMLSLVEGDLAAARRWLLRARRVHATPELRTLEGLVACSPR
jgi:hypothetical protein